MKLRQGEEYNASGTPNAHLTDEILRVYLVNGQENRDFLKDIILNMIQEMGKGQIVKEGLIFSSLMKIIKYIRVN